jgi:chaperonin cofactor prefoldin
MKDIPKLQEMITKARSVGSDVKNLSMAIESIATEISEITKEIDSFDICPLCGAKRE